MPGGTLGLANQDRILSASHFHSICVALVDPRGFEPQLLESEASVLPLDEGSMNTWPSYRLSLREEHRDAPCHVKLSNFGSGSRDRTYAAWVQSPAGYLYNIPEELTGAFTGWELPLPFVLSRCRDAPDSIDYPMERFIARTTELMVSGQCCWIRTNSFYTKG